MKKFSAMVAASLGVLGLIAASAFAEPYPGADRQQAEKLEAQAKAAIDAAKSRRISTRMAEYFYNKGTWEISLQKNDEAARDFILAQDALRPEPKPVPIAEDVTWPEPIYVNAVPPPAAPEERIAPTPRRRHRRIRRSKAMHKRTTTTTPPANLME